MSRYSKLYSNYILTKRHQEIKNGIIWSRDWVSIGNVHRLEPGKKPYYSDSGFIFTENALPFFKKKHDYGKWVAHFVYDDVKDASSEVNEVKVNRDSNDLRSYVYYGSCEDLIKGSIENIIKNFPGRLDPTTSTLVVQDADGSWIDTNKFVYENQFGLDMYTQTTSIADFDNELHYLTATWQQYNVVRLDADGNRTSVAPIIEYVVTNAEGEILGSKKYHDEGFDFICYKDFFFKWSEEEQKFIPVEYSTNCTNYFVMCDEYIRYRDKYYMWSYDDGQYLALNVLEICNDNYQKIYSVKLKAADEPDTYISVDVYRVNGEMVYCSLDNNFIIEPNKEVIDKYFNGLEGFEKKLLTRDTRPAYRNIFKVPYQLSNGMYTFVDRTFTWPSRDYCIDIESMAYETFVNALLDMAVLYDEVYSDCIWRCMTHESIKNFDWSYRREYNENDMQDNIDGGERMMEVLHFYGRIYDDAKRYVDGIRMTNNITYNGYDNCPDAEISDKNEIKGWDVISTIWEPYYYVLVDSVPEGVTVTPYPSVPTNINSESPEWISVGCETGAIYYHKEYNDPSLEFLTEEYLNDDNFIIGNCNPWIWHNHNAIYIDKGCNIPEGTPYEEMDEVPLYTSEDSPEWILVGDNYYQKTSVVYVEVYGDPMVNYTNYWNDRNTFTSVPATIDRLSPKAIRVVSGNQYTYYVLSEHAFDSSNYIHSRWYSTKNPNAVTPLTADIEFQRVLHLSTNRIFKTKGTRNSIEMVMALFGLGYGEDYTITEYCNYTNPVKADDTFYFYDELSDEPAGITWDNTNTFTNFDEVLPILGPNAPQYIKVENAGVAFYYEINMDYSYENMILELYRHKETERIYDDIYTGVPLNKFLIGNDNYIVPYYTQNRVYDGYLYFQQKGGWGKKTNSDFQYDYSETVPYLHLVPNVESLLSIFSNQLSENDVYYVFDTTDYVDFDEDVPFNLSHYFKAYDKYNPQRFSSWKNIPMEGNIVYDTNYNENGVTHEDYLHAKYLNDILPTIFYNNPHTGNGEYDLGKEYMEYMHAPYKYLFETYNFDDSRYVNIAKQFLFTVNEIVTTEPNEKFAKWLDTVSYSYNNGTLEKVINQFDSTEYFLNNKLIILRNEINNSLHKKFMKDVVVNYVLQVIPSTAILVLENFEINDASTVLKYTITATPNDPSFGETVGSGEYVNTTMAYLQAVEKEGYHFVHWEHNGEVVSTEIAMQVRVCGNDDYVAVFEEDCLIDVKCDTTCGIILRCDTAELCSTTFLCETDDMCDIGIVCSDEAPEQTATVKYSMKYYGATTADELARSLSDRVMIYDNTCDDFNTVLNAPDYKVQGEVVTESPCRVTPFPIEIDNIDITTLSTLPSVKNYQSGTSIRILGGTTHSDKIKEWVIETPDGVETTYTMNPITLPLTTGETKITAVFEEM